MVEVSSDFLFEVLSMGIMPHTSLRKLVICADGSCSFTFQKTKIKGKTGFEKKEFHIDDDKITKLYDLIKNSLFFELESKDSGHADGDLVEVKVTMNSKTHSVKLVNYPQKEIENIVRSTNELIPSKYHMKYNALTRSTRT